ncbi:hypothetical protein Bbelb_015140 [Branchiostoma belcheri]|nr:hypothetical protein Bbelb_015140 [Branchiostoma belcheri]
MSCLSAYILGCTILTRRLYRLISCCRGETNFLLPPDIEEQYMARLAEKENEIKCDQVMKVAAGVSRHDNGRGQRHAQDQVGVKIRGKVRRGQRGGRMTTLLSCYLLGCTIGCRRLQQLDCRDVCWLFFEIESELEDMKKQDQDIVRTGEVPTPSLVCLPLLCDGAPSIMVR